MHGDDDGPLTQRDAYRIGETLVGKYRVDGILGSGGMGKVLRAHHLQLGHPVAIKVMHGEPDAVDDPARRFALEARATAALESPNAVRILEVGRLPSGASFIVMELLVGNDLATIVQNDGPLTVERAIHYLLQAADAIAEAHAKGIIHRDLKPQNLFLTTAGVVKVLDFGLAKALRPTRPLPALTPESSRTATGMLVGSPDYMSPEQVRPGSSVDERTDVWGLGATLYHLLTGVPPFPAPSMDALVSLGASRREPPRVADRRDDVSKTVDAVLARCLRTNPAERYQTIAAFQGALLHLRIEVQTGSLRAATADAETFGTLPVSTERDPPATERGPSDDEPTEITTTLPQSDPGLASTHRSRR